MRIAVHAVAFLARDVRSWYTRGMSTAPQLRHEGFSWDDYRSWRDGKRWEIISGEAYDMTPAPTTRHQKIVSRLTHHLEAYLANRPCSVYPSPVDVLLSEDDVVQPDLVVVCDESQVKSTHIEGPPALVIEILSPSTEIRDRGVKLDLYAASGVTEVWLVTPYPSLIEVFLLQDRAYRRVHAFTREQRLLSPTFAGLDIDLNALFDFPIPPEERIEMVKEGHPPYAAKAETAGAGSMEDRKPGHLSAGVNDSHPSRAPVAAHSA